MRFVLLFFFPFGTTNTIRCFGLIWAEAQSEKPQYGSGRLGWETGVIQRKTGNGSSTTKGLLYFSIAGASERVLSNSVGISVDKSVAMNLVGLVMCLVILK